MERGCIFFALIALAEFIFIIFYKLPSKRKMDKKIREKLNECKIKKITFEETQKIGSIVRKDIFEFGDNKKNIEKERKHFNKELKNKIEKIKELEKSIEKFSNLFHNSRNKWEEIKNMISNLKILTEETSKLCLDTNHKQENYVKEMMQNATDFLETYREICCDACWNKFEFIARSKLYNFKAKRIN